MNDKLETLDRKLTSLRDEMLALRKRTGDLEERIRRLELRDEVLQNPGASGDAPITAP